LSSGNRPHAKEEKRQAEGLCTVSRDNVLAFSTSVYVSIHAPIEAPGIVTGGELHLRQFMKILKKDISGISLQ
jgi:hypothetical protein